jgi:hypothetical protein
LVEILIFQRNLLNKFFLSDPESEVLASLCAVIFVTEASSYIENPKIDSLKSILAKLGSTLQRFIFRQQGFAPSEYSQEVY